MPDTAPAFLLARTTRAARATAADWKWPATTSHSFVTPAGQPVRLATDWRTLAAAAVGTPLYLGEGFAEAEGYDPHIRALIAAGRLVVAGRWQRAHPAPVAP